MIWMRARSKKCVGNEGERLGGIFALKVSFNIQRNSSEVKISLMDKSKMRRMGVEVKEGPLGDGQEENK